jgi:L,D-transpeptidase catalytic domain
MRIRSRLWRFIVPLLLVGTTGMASGADTLVISSPVHDARTVAALRKTALSLSDYARKNGLDETVFFLVDMKMPSGKNRFFVYDLSKDSILMAGLVTQGKGNGPWRLAPQFSNNSGSACTSLGRYKIGGSYQGAFGLAYKLHGLDSSNSNAYARYVVLHAHESVPDKEVHPYPICQSEGCPTVSKTFLSKLDQLLQKKSKPLLLYIYH